MKQLRRLRIVKNKKIQKYQTIQKIKKKGKVMTTFMTILGWTLFCFAVFAIGDCLLTKESKRFQELTQIVSITIFVSCAVLLLVNDAVAVKPNWTRIAVHFLLPVAVVYLCGLIIAIVMQCHKKEFKMKWDSDGLLLLSIVVLGLTGYIATI